MIKTSVTTPITEGLEMSLDSNMGKWQFTVTYLNGTDSLATTAGEVGTLELGTKYLGNEGFTALTTLAGSDTGEVRTATGALVSLKASVGTAFTGAATAYRVTAVGFKD